MISTGALRKNIGTYRHDNQCSGRKSVGYATGNRNKNNGDGVFRCGATAGCYHAVHRCYPRSGDNQYAGLHHHPAGFGLGKRIKRSSSSKLAGNFSASGNAARFAGLGSALMERFAHNGGNYSQSVIRQTASSQADSATSLATVSRQSQLHTKADNQISLSIKTASGALVDITLGSDADGLVQVNVSKGTLSDADRQALAKMLPVFQKQLMDRWRSRRSWIWSGLT